MNINNIKQTKGCTVYILYIKQTINQFLPSHCTLAIHMNIYLPDQGLALNECAM